MTRPPARTIRRTRSSDPFSQVATPHAPDEELGDPEAEPDDPDVEGEPDDPDGEPDGEPDGTADGDGVALDGSGEGATDGGADAADGAALDVGTPLAPGAATQPMAMVADRTAAAGRSSRVMAAR